MTERGNSKDLPEPGHPFARWGAGAIVGLWALSAQYFPDPWSKLGAILSPGAGYLFGQVLDLIILKVSIANVRRVTQRTLTDNKKSEEVLHKERQEAITRDANPKIIAEIDENIVLLQRERIYIITQLAKLTSADGRRSRESRTPRGKV